VTDYWGEPTATPEWRRPMTEPLDMPGDGIWPDAVLGLAGASSEPAAERESRRLA